LVNRFIRNRPKQLLAVYVEPGQVDVLRARRKWRTWQIDSVEQFQVPNDEVIFDFLQRLNLRPRGRGGASMLLLLPRLYYGFHREHYPAAIEQNLEETLTFDWPENVFQQPEQTLHFFGKASKVNHHISVPIFSLRQDIYEKFFQALGGAGFQSFSVVPTAPYFSAFFSQNTFQEGFPQVTILARMVGASHLEIQKFYKGALLDSSLVRKDGDQLRLFRESLSSLDGSGSAEEIPVHFICQPGEYELDCLQQWKAEQLPIKPHGLEKPMIFHWVEYMLRQDSVETFNPPLFLKPWEIPKVAYFVLAVVLLYSLYAYSQVRTYDRLTETQKLLSRQRAQLEAEWKPVEQLQVRIGKFEEDQKALAQFDDEGYPMLGLLTLLTEVTPKDTWFNYLALREKELTLRGESTSAIKYLTELSKVKGFEDVRFASPVTRNPASDKERFNVQLRINMPAMKTTLQSIPLEGEMLDIPEKGTDTAEPLSAPTDPFMAEPSIDTTGPEDDTSNIQLSPSLGDDATSDQRME
jgi:Tfp pilus assembly protein PilN